jgi:hypothetical protein
MPNIGWMKARSSLDTAWWVLMAGGKATRRSPMPTDPRDKSDEIAKESYARSMAPLDNDESPQTPAYEVMQTWPEEAADVYYDLGGEEP